MSKKNKQAITNCWAKIRNDVKRLISSSTAWQVGDFVYNMECDVADQIEDLIYAPICQQIWKEAENK